MTELHGHVAEFGRRQFRLPSTLHAGVWQNSLGESATFLTLDQRPLVFEFLFCKICVLHWYVSWTLFGKCGSPPVHGASLIHGCWQTTVVSSWLILSHVEMDVSSSCSRGDICIQRS